MKNTLIALFFLFVSCQIFAQGSSVLYALFPEMPASISDAELRAMITDAPRIPKEHFGALQQSEVNDENEYVALGKFVTKTTTILLFARIADRPVADGAPLLMNVIKSACVTKTGEHLGGSLGFYLAMSGEDALRREAKITYSGTKVEFWTKSTELDDSKSEIEIQVYTLGKKDLEFSETKKE